MLGNTGLRVRAIGLGGQALLETKGQQKTAKDLVNAPRPQGVRLLGVLIYDFSNAISQTPHRLHPQSGYKKTKIFCFPNQRIYPKNRRGSSGIFTFGPEARNF
jgi:hypothetical protein